MTKATKPQRNQLVVQGVDFAHWWNVDQFVPKQDDVSLKRALGGNQVNDE